MTIYNHKVTFQHLERVEIEKMANRAIAEFKLKHAVDGLAVPWVLESILKKLKNANMTLLSTNNFADGGNGVFINVPDKTQVTQ